MVQLAYGPTYIATSGANLYGDLGTRLLPPTKNDVSSL